MSDTGEQSEGPEEQPPLQDDARADQNPQASGENAGGISHQQIKHHQVSARVPDDIGRGVFSTGAIVLTGNTEFVVDFLVRMSRPYQVAARVVMPHGALFQLLKALEENLRKYAGRYGEIPPLPQPTSPVRQPSIQEIYDDLKLPDDQLSGAYANGCIIGHSPAEFVLDFVTNFFPRSSVSARVFMSARQMPQLIKGVRHAAEQLKRRQAEQTQPPSETPEQDVPPGSDPV